nr:hypothetical protein [Mycoplasmopsis bovis]
MFFETLAFRIIFDVDLLMQEEYNLLSKGANSFKEILHNLDFEEL